MKSIPIFKGTTGLNTKLDPTRIKFNPETGISDLAACVNCSIDDTGRPFLRKGFTATARIEAWKNLFSCGNFALGTKGNALCIIEADMSYKAIRNITQEARMSYVRDTDGAQEIIYYCNSYEKGRVVSKVSYNWPVSTYIGPETRKKFYAAPIGHLLEIRNLRMFIAEDKTLWYSEPGNYSSYRLGANFFGFSSRLRMVQAVAGGLWISDSESIYFLGGEIIPSKLEMPRQIKMADYPAIEGSAVKVRGSKIGEGMPGMAVVFTSEAGICIGSGDGQLINVTEKKIALPTGLSGAGFYRDGKYTCTLD